MQWYDRAKIYVCLAVLRYYKGPDVPLVQHVKHSSQPCDGKLQKPDPMLGSYNVELSILYPQGQHTL